MSALTALMRSRVYFDPERQRCGRHLKIESEKRLTRSLTDGKMQGVRCAQAKIQAPHQGGRMGYVGRLGIYPVRAARRPKIKVCKELAHLRLGKLPNATASRDRGAEFGCCEVADHDHLTSNAGARDRCCSLLYEQGHQNACVEIQAQ